MTTSREIQVEAYAGHRGYESPRALYVERRRVEILDIIDRWITEDIDQRDIKRFFTVICEDGFIYKICYDDLRGKWYQLFKERSTA
ncbi:MAG: hypothetical protein JSV13_02610 [Nitrospiraceae bacterium]|jgi:hypothetical protein|nr:MAG: hypothetical protein JSV13_02610 [Nitrospiraceae bacterium]